MVDRIIKTFPKDVKFVYKNMPLTTIHRNALPAAKAAVAAGKQGKFWEMHDVLFKHSRELTYDKLKEYAKQIGLDVAQWEEDFASPEVQAAINRDLQAARKAEVRGTPTFFVNGKRVLNRSFDNFKRMIEEAKKQALAKKGKKG